MKYWHILTVFLLAMAIVIVGALLKITHRTDSNYILAIGMGGQALALILLIIKIVKGRTTNEALQK